MSQVCGAGCPPGEGAITRRGTSTMTTIRTLSILTAGLLAACGGSGSGTSGGSQVTRGTVTARTASSITVNGVQLSTAGAAVRVDDHPTPGGLDDVRLGDVV